MSRLTILLVVSLALAGCTDRSPSPIPTPVATATATASPTAVPPRLPAPIPTSPLPSSTPAGTRSGLPPGVNAVIDLVLAHDATALERLAQLASVPCGPGEGSGSPPTCPAGQPAGTPVAVFPIARCSGDWLRAAAIRAALEEVTGASPLLVGVYRTPNPYLPWAKGEYVAVFSRQVRGQPLGAGFIIDGDRVTGLWFGCGASASQIVPPGTPPLFLPGG